MRLKAFFQAPTAKSLALACVPAIPVRRAIARHSSPINAESSRFWSSVRRGEDHAEVYAGLKNLLGMESEDPYSGPGCRTFFAAQQGN